MIRPSPSPGRRRSPRIAPTRWLALACAGRALYAERRAGREPAREAWRAIRSTWLWLHGRRPCADQERATEAARLASGRLADFAPGEWDEVAFKAERSAVSAADYTSHLRGISARWAAREAARKARFAMGPREEAWQEQARGALLLAARMAGEGRWDRARAIGRAVRASIRDGGPLDLDRRLGDPGRPSAIPGRASG